MILRSRDIPALRELEKDHRHQVVSKVERMVFWKPKSLLVILVLSTLSLAGVVSTTWLATRYDDPQWPLRALTPLIIGCLATLAYRVIGLNSFYLPTLHAMISQSLPHDTKRPFAFSAERIVLPVLILQAVETWCFIRFASPM